MVLITWPVIAMFGQNLGGYPWQSEKFYPKYAEVIQIAAGDVWTLALQPDGSLEAYGFDAPTIGNDDYQPIFSELPAGNDFIQIAGRYHNAAALREDGSIVTWGHNWYNILESPSGNDYKLAAMGACAGAAIRLDGSLVAWGRDDYHQLLKIPEGNDFLPR